MIQHQAVDKMARVVRSAKKQLMMVPKQDTAISYIFKGSEENKEPLPEVEYSVFNIILENSFSISI